MLQVLSNMYGTVNGKQLEWSLYCNYEEPSCKDFLNCKNIYLYYLVFKERIVQIHIKAVSKCYVCLFPFDRICHVQCLVHINKLWAFLSKINMDNLHGMEVARTISYTNGYVRWYKLVIHKPDCRCIWWRYSCGSIGNTCYHCFCLPLQQNLKIWKR